MKLIYDVKDKPAFSKLIFFALQQLLAIMAATIAVPNIINNNNPNANMTPAAALVGAGLGTIVYLLFTKFRSPVFLGSSFAFLGSLASAFAGGVSMAKGFAGIIIGAAMAGLIYVIIAIVVKFVGVSWVSKLMPAVVIGPTVAIIGLSLSGNAVGDLVGGKGFFSEVTTSYMVQSGSAACIVCGLVTLFVTMLCSVYGKKMMKLIPFVIGIVAGYAVALIFTIIGKNCDMPSLVIINFDPFIDAYKTINLNSFLTIPKFTFIEGFKGLKDLDASYITTIAVAYIPVAFVVFAEHIADHKNLSSIIEKDLLEDPGLSRTLLGDGVGSMVGAVFGGCPNTTYGESVGCVAITKNASVISIFVAALMAIAFAFVTPFVLFLSSIPACVMGGVCIALYGFIAISGLKMIQKVDFEDNANLFTASVIFIAGVGNLSLSFANDQVVLRTVACALILGIVTNIILNKKKKK